MAAKFNTFESTPVDPWPNRPHLNNVENNLTFSPRQRRREIMREFEFNGIDTSFETEPAARTNQATARPKSWIAPILRRPQPRRPASFHFRDEQTTALITELLSEEQLKCMEQMTEGQLQSVNFLLTAAMQLGAPFPRKNTPKTCSFCKKNGELEKTYSTHEVKDSSGRVTCPILRAFTCEQCGASGDKAHTRKYCPKTAPEEKTISAAIMRNMRAPTASQGFSPTAPMKYSFTRPSPMNESFTRPSPMNESFTRPSSMYNLFTRDLFARCQSPEQTMMYCTTPYNRVLGPEWEALLKRMNQN